MSNYPTRPVMLWTWIYILSVIFAFFIHSISPLDDPQIKVSNLLLYKWVSSRTFINFVPLCGKTFVLNIFHWFAKPVSCYLPTVFLAICKKIFIKVIIYNQFAVAMKHDEMLYKSHVSLCTMHFFFVWKPLQICVLRG